MTSRKFSPVLDHCSLSSKVIILPINISKIVWDLSAFSLFSGAVRTVVRPAPMFGVTTATSLAITNSGSSTEDCALYCGHVAMVNKYYELLMVIDHWSINIFMSDTSPTIKMGVQLRESFVCQVLETKSELLVATWKMLRIKNLATILSTIRGLSV